MAHQEVGMVRIVIVSLVGAIVVGVLINPLLSIVPILVGAIAANRMGYRHQGEAIAKATGQSAGARPNVADELAKLADLRDRGALSPDEFESQKARLLGPR